MKSTYKLVWSDEALNGLQKIINYIENKFGEKSITKFAKKLDKQLDLMSINPLTFKESNKSNGIRRAIVAKLTSVYFKVEDDQIKIISVFDNRMNQNELKQ